MKFFFCSADSAGGQTIYSSLLFGTAQSSCYTTPCSTKLHMLPLKPISSKLSLLYLILVSLQFLKLFEVLFSDEFSERILSKNS